jgi:hypothetical protein
LRAAFPASLPAPDAEASTASDRRAFLQVNTSTGCLPSMSSFKCVCGQSFSFEHVARDRIVQCPSCRTQFRIPASPRVSTSPSSGPSAGGPQASTPSPRTATPTPRPARASTPPDSSPATGSRPRPSVGGVHAVQASPTTASPPQPASGGSQGATPPSQPSSSAAPQAATPPPGSSANRPQASASTFRPSSGGSSTAAPTPLQPPAGPPPLQPSPSRHAAGRSGAHTSIGSTLGKLFWIYVSFA